MRTLLTVFSLIIVMPLFAQVERSVVVEHFTNTRCGICASRNPAFYALLDANPDVIHVSYHPSSPYSSCIFSLHNVAENDARTNFYGVYGGTPRAVLQGEVLAPSNPLVSQEQINNRLGEMSDFSIDILQSPAGNGEVSVTIKVKRKSGSGAENLKLYCALAERIINYNAPNGEDEHRNVFRRKLQEFSITLGTANDSVVLSQSYEPHSEWMNDEIVVVAILQNMNDKSVVQAARSDIVTSVNEINRSVDLSGAFYPNPVGSLLHFDAEATERYQSARLYDLFGLLVRESDLESPVDMRSLSPGYYFIVFEDGSGNAFTAKVIRTRP